MYFKVCFILYLVEAYVLSSVSGVITVNNATTSVLDRESFANITKENNLWRALIKNCKKPSMACIKKSVYSYLDDTLNYPNDLQLTEYVRFTRNNVEYQINDAENVYNASGDTNETLREHPRSPMEEVSRALHNKAVKFMMTHDMELKLPETLFDGAILKVSPRSVEGDGTIVKLDVIPKEIEETGVAQPRIFFKKIKKAIGEKLMMALMAILMVIKLLAVKFLFFLPTVLGVTAAKKFILKMILFVFPFLSHFFKLCPYVPHGVKYHHHKHQIAHIHHVGPHGAGPPPHEIVGSPEYVPSIHHHTDVQFHPGPSYKPHEEDLEFYSDGPGFTHEFITHRKDASGKPIPEEGSNDPSVYGSGQGQRVKKPPKNGPLTPAEIENMVLKAEKEALLKARLQQEHLKVQAENLRLQQQIKQALKLQDKLKQSQMFMNPKRGLPGAGAIATLPANVPVPHPSPYLQLPSPQKDVINTKLQNPGQPNLHTPIFQTAGIQMQSVKPQMMQSSSTLHTKVQTSIQQPTYQAQNFQEAVQKAAAITFDPFYSPILEKIDKILVGLGYNDEPCRERLICSMYKNPPKYSPHSNLLSAELSRDSNELQKPTTSNAAVIRFYRYVQAARDGQDKRECLRLYPCAINTEK